MRPLVEKKTKKGKPKTFLVCEICGHKEATTQNEAYTLKEQVQHSDVDLIEVVEGEDGSPSISEDMREELQEHYREMLEFIDPE